MGSPYANIFNTANKDNESISQFLIETKKHTLLEGSGGKSTSR